MLQKGNWTINFENVILLPSMFCVSVILHLILHVLLDFSKFDDVILSSIITI